jgi:hypothetical protein
MVQNQPLGIENILKRDMSKCSVGTDQFMPATTRDRSILQNESTARVARSQSSVEGCPFAIPLHSHFRIRW